MDDLVSRAKKGDPDAFTDLMHSQMQSMYKTARSILSRDADAADAVSETILTCWEQMGSLKYNRYFKTWMTRILINKCYELIRKNRIISSDAKLPEQGYFEISYENIEWKETLDSIPEKYRLVMMLYYVEGFKVSEISKILEISEGTVKSRLARGRDNLKNIFEFRQRRVNI